MRVLMICLGNICRSPTAEAALRRAAHDAGRSDVVVESRGTAGWHEGKGADPRTVAHAKARGLDLSGHRARKLARADLVDFDVVYAMDEANLEDVRQLCRGDDGLLGKVSLFLGDRGVPDPWSGGPADFERVLDLCEGRALVLISGL